jgi:hypothetical protein
MPSSLVVVGLVLAWLVVLVPMIVRKRQEVSRTADSTLSARVVRSGAEDEEFAEHEAEEEAAMNDTGRVEQDFRDDVEDDDVEEEFADDLAEDGHGAADDDADDEMSDEFTARYRQTAYQDYDYGRRYRPGRGGFDPEAAAVIARAKYAFRQRVVLAMLIGAVATAVTAAVAVPTLWWGHGALDLALVSYLAYLRRQVRIETEIRERRLARMQRARRARPRPAEMPAQAEEPLYEPEPEPEVDPTLRERVADGPAAPPAPVHPRGAVVVDIDDEDPAFDELEEPGSLPYRRAVGE